VRGNGPPLENCLGTRAILNLPAFAASVDADVWLLYDNFPFSC
jgi:hypothetical protein